MERLKKLWAKALRKAGVSVHDRIFDLTINNLTFEQFREGSRTAFIVPWDAEFKISSLVRLRAFKSDDDRHYNREAYYYINEIIGPNDTSCLMAGYCVLVLG